MKKIISCSTSYRFKVENNLSLDILIFTLPKKQSNKVLLLFEAVWVTGSSSSEAVGVTPAEKDTKWEEWLFSTP